MTDIATNEPAELRAGLTWQWRREDLTADYPASVWTLKYWFKKTGASGANFSIQATADGDQFAIEVDATTTGAYTAGDYTWVAIVSSGADAFEVDRGFAALLPRYDVAANLDDRSHARKMLDQVEAAIEALSLGVKSYSIGSRTLTRRDLPELLDLRARYLAEVRKEDADAGETSPGVLFVRL